MMGGGTLAITRRRVEKCRHALESQVNRDGSLVVRGVRALAIEDEGAHKPCRVSTNAGDVFADQVIVATHVPMGDAHLAVHAKLSAHGSYVIAAIIRTSSLVARFRASGRTRTIARAEALSAD